MKNCEILFKKSCLVLAFERPSQSKFRVLNKTLQFKRVNNIKLQEYVYKKLDFHSKMVFNLILLGFQS